MPTAEPALKKPPSERAFGLAICLAIVVGNMVGSGVYLLPAALAPYGWNAVLGWTITIGGTLCLALIFARMARAFPEAGGPYVFVREAFGRPAGFAVAWTYWVSVWVANAAIATAAVSYLTVFFPGLNNVAGLPAVVALGIIWSLTLVNCGSIRAAGGFQLVTTILKLIPVFGAIVLATVLLSTRAGEANPPPLTDESFSLAAVGASAALTLWAMQGFETATIPAGRVRDPARNIPLATIYGTLTVGILYVFAATAVTMLLPGAESSDAPFADFFGLYVGSGVGMAIALFAAVSAIGALNGWILIQGELPLALARDGSFPRWFARTSAAGTPVLAQLVGSGLVSILVISNYSRSIQQLFVFMALLATVAALVLYLVCAPAALVLMRRGALPRSGLTTAAALIGLVYAAWTLVGAGLEATTWGAFLLTLGVPVWFAMKRFSLTDLPTPPPAAHPAAPPGSAA